MPLRALARAGLPILGGLLLAASMTAWAQAPVEDLTDEERLARLEQLFDNGGLAEMVTRLESLQQDLQRLQGEMEVQNHHLEQLQSSQRKANQDIERRLHELELRVGTVSGTDSSAPALMAPAASAPPSDPGAPSLSAASDTVPAASGPTTPPAPPPTPAQTAEAAPTTPATPANASADGTASTPPAGDEQAAYQQAFGLLKQGRYDQAITALRDFITRYPDGANTPNAQYWLGEAYYVKRNFKDAQQSFQTLLERYPNTPKRPDAALKIGFIHYELQEWEPARKVLTDVKAGYPDSAAAKLAENRLQKMSKEGH